ncbi:MAG: hypothetical protein QXH23_00060 [archaeon]
MILGFMGIVFLYVGVRSWIVKKALERLETSKIGDLGACKGKLVEIRGKVVPAEKVVMSPFMNKECVMDWYGVSIEAFKRREGITFEYSLLGDVEKDKKEVHYATSYEFLPFYVQDETGSILVDSKKVQTSPLSFTYKYSTPYPKQTIVMGKVISEQNVNIPPEILDAIKSGKVKFAQSLYGALTKSSEVAINPTLIAKMQINESYIPVGEEVWVIGIVKDNEYTNEEWAKRGTNPELMIGEGKEVFEIICGSKEEQKIIKKLKTYSYVGTGIGVTVLVICAYLLISTLT